MIRPALDAELAASVDSILARLAHDLRNPLAVVLSNLRFLADEINDSALQEAAEESALSAERLSSMIDNAASIVPLRRGRSQPTFTELSLCEMRERIDRITAPTLGSKRLIWEGVQGQLVTDGQLLERAVAAIIAHCIRHSPPATSTTVRVQFGDELLLQVIDEGPPFPPGHEPSFLSDALAGPSTSDDAYRSDGDLGLQFAGIAARVIGARTAVRQRDDGRAGLVFELRIALDRGQNP